MTEETARKLRLQDFDERRQSDPSAIYYVREHGWEYLAVHPMSDDVELLARLRIKPDECVAVDCYWLVDDDVVFLQVYSKQFLDNRQPGLYAQLRYKNIPGLNLSAYLNEPMISRTKVEEVMLRFYRLNLHSERVSHRLSEKLTLISTEV
jgi:hypothetical protein